MFFFFNDTATTEIYTLSLHDALPICRGSRGSRWWQDVHHHGRRSLLIRQSVAARPRCGDRKSTRLNSSHDQISYAVFCLKKKTTRAATACPTSYRHTSSAAQPSLTFD